jgi:aquaporin Z
MQPKEPQKPNPTEIQRLGAEFLGTLLLTFTAAGADVLDQATPPGTIGHVARYLAPALMVMAMIYSLSAISGAHINPVVTLAFFARKAFPGRRVPGYWLAQIFGACTAGLMLRAMFGRALHLGINHPSFGFTALQAIVTETILSFALVYTILATSEEEGTVGKNAGLAIGGLIALAGLAFSPVSGASMNPARSFGPAFVGGDLHSIWIYIAGPAFGAIVAALAVGLIHGPPTSGQITAARGKENTR